MHVSALPLDGRWVLVRARVVWVLVRARVVWSGFRGRHERCTATGLNRAQ